MGPRPSAVSRYSVALSLVLWREGNRMTQCPAGKRHCRDIRRQAMVTQMHCYAATGRLVESKSATPADNWRVVGWARLFWSRRGRSFGWNIASGCHKPCITRYSGLCAVTRTYLGSWCLVFSVIGDRTKPRGGRKSPPDLSCLIIFASNFVEKDNSCLFHNGTLHWRMENA